MRRLNLAERVNNMSRRGAITLGTALGVLGVAEMWHGMETESPTHLLLGVAAVGGSLYVAKNAPNMHGLLEDAPATPSETEHLSEQL